MICDRLINELEIKYPAIKLDNYVIMPNHIHLLLSVDEANGRGDPSPTISQLMGWFKYQATKEINGITKSGEKVFQRSFYDHVVRNQRDYREIWEYIDSNPAKWKIDKLYCEN